VFSVRYGQDLYMLFGRNPVCKGLMMYCNHISANKVVLLYIIITIKYFIKNIQSRSP
jgi:hypothetical protein